MSRAAGDRIMKRLLSSDLSRIAPVHAQTTLMLQQLADGDRAAFDQLLPRVYEELKQIANQYLAGEQRPDVLQATGLVHEAYLRLIDQRKARYEDRSHFLAVASTVMRRVLLDHVRARKAAKRGGSEQIVQLDTLSELQLATEPVDLLAFDDVLTQLEDLNPRHAKVVEMRFFGGLTVEETATALGVSPATVKNDWRAARAWLAMQLEQA